MVRKVFKRILLGVAFVALLGVTAVVGIILWDMPPRSEREYMALRWEWDKANLQRQTHAERQAQDRQFVDRCVRLAEEYPGTTGELAALLLADDRSCELPERGQLHERVLTRIKSAAFEEILRASGYGLPCQLSPDLAAPAVYARVQQHLEHPMAPYVLCTVGAAVAANSEALEPPPMFSEIAGLLESRFAASPHVSSFCGVLGNGHYSPPWAPQFEWHVRRILEVNQHRFVRMSGSLALAEIAHLSPDRQLEAEQLYQAFLREFDGQTEYEAQIIEQQAGAAARDRLKSMEFAPLGRPAPEIVGVDLEGQPLSLSAFRGQVVLLSFWATWCGPCMKLVPYERELLAQFAGRPLVILGINADEDPATALAAAQKKEMTWKSFRDRSTAGETISEQWAALFPTFYVIDHQGVIRQRFCGVLPPELLQETVGPLVSAAEAAAGAP